MSDIVSQPNDSTEVSLRKAVELLGQIETKTGTAEITGEVTVSNEVEIKNTDNAPVPVSGTVTASVGDGGSPASLASGKIAWTPGESYPVLNAVRLGFAGEELYNGVGLDSGGAPLPVKLYTSSDSTSGIGSGNPLPVSGTVTANVVGQDEFGSAQPLPFIETDGSANAQREMAVSATIVDNDGNSIFNNTNGSRGIPIAGRSPTGIDYITAENNRLDTNVKNSVTVTALGAAADASATTDTGTFSLISLFKRLLGKLPSLTASSRVPVDVLPSSVTLVNAGSNFSYSSPGNYGAFDCGDADFVVFTTSGGGGGYAHNIELSNASNFSSVLTTASGQVVVYNERYPSDNNDSVAYRYSNSTLQQGSAGTYVINLTQGTTKYTHVRLAVSGSGGGGWTGRFTSYRSALRDAGANITQMLPLHRVPIAGVVDINSCTRSIPVTGTVTANAGTGTYTIQPRNGAVTKTRGTTSSTANTSAAAPSPLNVTDSNRRYLLIQNISDTDMYVNFGAAATTDDLLISKNGGGVVFESGFVPTDSVNVICSAASKKYFILSA